MEQSIEHGVSDGGIREELVPFARRQLACDKRRVARSPVVDHLKEMVASMNRELAHHW